MRCINEMGQQMSVKKGLLLLGSSKWEAAAAAGAISCVVCSEFLIDLPTHSSAALGCLFPANHPLPPPSAPFLLFFVFTHSPFALSLLRVPSRFVPGRSSIAVRNKMPRYHSIDDDVHVQTKWWSDYPTQRFTGLAKAQTAFDNIIGEVWSKPKRMVRSASYTNLTYYKEAQHDYPIKRSTSVSSLAPSLALPQYYRQAERIVHTERVYKPFIYDWYNNAYSQHRFIDTQREIMRPLKRDPAPLRYKQLKFEQSTPRSSWVPFYSNQTRRIYNDERTTPMKSYLHGSQNYLDKYVSSRLKSNDYAQRFAYSAYEWRKPVDHAFNRNFMYGERVYVPHARSNPHSYSSASALRKLYKTTGRFRFA